MKPHRDWWYYNWMWSFKSFILLWWIQHNNVLHYNEESHTKIWVWCKMKFMVSVTLQNEAILFKWTTFSCLLLDWQSYCALGPELSFYQNYKSSIVICSVLRIQKIGKINFSLVSLKIHKYSFLQIQILCRWQQDLNFTR